MFLHTDWFTVGPNKVIRGIIDTNSDKFYIREFDSSLVISGQAKDLRQAKALVKKHLRESGVNFTDEIRSR